MKPDYRFYATLLDGFQYHLKSDDDGSFQSFIDRVNRVPFQSDAADKGTSLNDLVDHLAAGGAVKTDTKGFYVWDRFTFSPSVVDYMTGIYTGAMAQVFTSAILETRKGTVELYGYIDELLPGEVHDIKGTGRYAFPKFLHAWQKVVYPYCLEENGIYCPEFTYLITDYSQIYREDYRYVRGRDLPRLVLFCEELIDFLENHRHLITDRKVFGMDPEPDKPKQEVRLTADIYSSFKDRMSKDKKTYGHKGDVVAVVNGDGDVMIVEDGDGNRFPVHRDNTMIHENGQDIPY